MKRFSFLGLLGLGTAAAALPPIAIPGEPEIPPASTPIPQPIYNGGLYQIYPCTYTSVSAFTITAGTFHLTSQSFLDSLS